MISSTASRGLRALLAAALLALGGCATTAPLLTNVEPLELDDVPFFPQTQYQCGPAALATILTHEGVAVDPESLAGAVYVAGLHGSLQLELLGATRRNGRIPYVLEPQSAALFAELAAGRPVLVLQNLGLVRVPVWHYAVLVGADRAADRVILRSGAERRRLERTARFLRSWEKGESWAFVALRPGELPATATPDRYIRSLAGAEALLTPDATGAAYRTALAEWPDDPLVLFSAATRRQVEHDLEAAIALYRRLLAFAPEHAAARNNLANALAEQGCYAAALTEARTALASIDPDDGLYAAISATVAEVAAAQDTHASAECAAL